MENGNASGCCSWRKSCCGGGCCSRTPDCCSTGQGSPESWKRPQYYNGQPGMGYGLAMAYGYGMRMGNMISGLISMAPDRMPCASSEGRPKCYGGDCGGSLSVDSSKMEVSNGSNTVKEAVPNGTSGQNGATSENAIKQEPGNGIKQEPANGAN